LEVGIEIKYLEVTKLELVAEEYHVNCSGAVYKSDLIILAEGKCLH
jgi:hypothetical protein